MQGGMHCVSCFHDGSLVSVPANDKFSLPGRLQGFRRGGWTASATNQLSERSEFCEWRNKSCPAGTGNAVRPED